MKYKIPNAILPAIRGSESTMPAKRIDHRKAKAKPVKLFAPNIASTINSTAKKPANTAKKPTRYKAKGFCDKIFNLFRNAFKKYHLIRNELPLC